MATVHYGDHEPFQIDDHRADLVAYYRGEGATVEVDDEVESPQVSDATAEPRHGVDKPQGEPADEPDPLDQH